MNFIQLKIVSFFKKNLEIFLLVILLIITIFITQLYNSNTKKIQRIRNRNMQDRSFKRSNDISRLNSEFGNRENGFRRKNNRNNGNVDKLILKYNELAREALSNGDKILSENYYQYADHFLRISIEQKEKQKDKSQTSIETV